MKTPSFRAVRIVLFVFFVMALVCVPFVLWGEEYVGPILKAREHQALWLVGISIVLLAADSVAPVPATVVIMFLAAKAGTLAGIIGGTIGMTAGVLAAAWFGRVAVGRIAPKFFPDEEVSRLRESLQQRLALTLACLRSVPVLAETSVIIAAAMGIPLKRIVAVTLLPNLAVSLIYSLAADDSFQTACLAFLGTLAASAVLWFWLRNRRSV
ncbi:MAG TPA: VTT domain-containing protein [Opitutaceae bacterium]|nr:VTT domain-containing protein [Opitutaceae bacterium]